MARVRRHVPPDRPEVPLAAPLRLTVTLQTRGPAAAIVLSDEQVAELAGGAKTFPVSVAVDGHGSFRGRLGAWAART